MKNKEYIAPEFSLVAIRTNDVITGSPGFDAEDNWLADIFDVK